MNIAVDMQLYIFITLMILCAAISNLFTFSDTEELYDFDPSVYNVRKSR